MNCYSCAKKLKVSCRAKVVGYRIQTIFAVARLDLEHRTNTTSRDAGGFIFVGIEPSARQDLVQYPFGMEQPREGASSDPKEKLKPGKGKSINRARENTPTVHQEDAGHVKTLSSNQVNKNASHASRVDLTLASRHDVDPVDLSMARDAEILLYIKEEMQKIYLDRHETDGMPADWVDEDALRQLAAHAEGDFIWAVTAMKLLSTTENPVQQLAELVAKDRPAFTLHELYKTALRSLGIWGPGETRDRYRRVLGIIVVSQVPLTDEAMGELLGFAEPGRACRVILQRLSCVIQWSDGQPARTFHPSFREYLTDRNLCSSEPWYIDVQKHQQALAVSCLRVMNTRLRFNMCDLESSHIRNADVPDLATRVEQAVSQGLSYSCQFLGYHLGQTAAGRGFVMPLLQIFMEEKFLYWLECLSLMGKLQTVSRTLRQIRIYLPVSLTFTSYSDRT